jgi:hypothetical protein
VACGELADRGHARAGAQQALVDAGGNEAHDLVGQRLAGIARQAQDGRIGHFTITVKKLSSKVYCDCIGPPR